VCKVQHATSKGPVSVSPKFNIHIHARTQYSPKYTDIYIFMFVFMYLCMWMCVYWYGVLFCLFHISLELLSFFNSYRSNNCRCGKELSAFAIFWWFLHNQFYHHHWVSIRWFSFIPCENAIGSTDYCLVLSEILVSMFPIGRDYIVFQVINKAACNICPISPLMQCLDFVRQPGMFVLFDYILFQLSK